MRRATTNTGKHLKVIKIFLSTLSLRRATSIETLRTVNVRNFYPRSPCGERPQHKLISMFDSPFLSTLSLRRATLGAGESCNVCRNFYPRSPCGERHSRADNIKRHKNFYPRSPCGERLKTPCVKLSIEVFLSTLSLRRATSWPRGMILSCLYFYPRSPCGERPWARGSRVTYVEISIHALLAESDVLAPNRPEEK